MAQNVTKVSGRIVDSYGDPVIGAAVVVKGTTVGTVTDMDGNYTLDAPEGSQLQVSFIGYNEAVMPVGNGGTVNFTLEEELTELDQVVVVGYGTQKKKDLTGSITSIKSDDIQNVAAANAMQAMQGKVPGMDLQQSNGQAGAGVSITLRGNRSVSADNGPLILVDGVEYGSTLDIPAGDIESMDILKDASSTAIYGTKGANGVIIITTKRGKAGTSNVNVNAYWAFNAPTAAVKSMYGDTEVQRWLDRANYQADLASGNWGTSNVKAADVFGSQTITDGTKVVDIIAAGSYADWYDEIFQNSTTQNYEVSVSGGSENTNFNLSMAAMLDRGLMKNDAMNRYNARLNLDHRINGIFKVGSSMAFTFKDHDARNSSVFNSARKMTSITHVYNEDGSINETPNVWYAAHVNPLMDEGDNFQKNVQSSRFLGSVYAQADIIDGLVLRSQLSLDRSNSRTGQYQDFKSVGRYQAPSTTALSNNPTMSTKLTWQNTLNFNRTFSNDHTLGVLIGHEMTKSIKEGLSLSGTAGKEHYYNSSFYDVTKMQADVQYSSEYTQQSLLSVFGRLNYSILSRYLFQASLRADGSSVLADGNKWGSFPSVSAGWRISEESFMEGARENAHMDNLKVRFSWGVSGNAAVAPYQTMSTVTSTTPNSATDFIPSVMGNKSLSWETTKAWNVGLDFGFFNGRLSGSVDFYNTNTTDLLYPKAAPSSSVFTSVLSNVGESKGSGIEIALNAVPVQIGDFAWDLNASYTSSKDEIVALADGLDRNISGRTGHIVGEALSIYYDYEVANCWNVGEYEEYLKANNLTTNEYAKGYGTPGTIRIVDQNMDGKIDEDDKIVYNRAPKHIFGMTNTFSWKGLSLSVQMMARMGGYMSYEKNTALGLEDNDANWADVEYWTPNRASKIQSPGANSKELVSLYTTYKTAVEYEKADYFKVKDITLAYSLPKDLIGKWRMSNAKVYCSLKNYFTSNKLNDDYDPERGGSISFPLAKQFVVGLNLQF